MSHPKTCPHCRASLPTRPSRLLGILAVTGAWITAMAMVFGGLMLGPLILFVLPFLFAGGMSVITVAHTWAFEDWTCNACGKLIESEPTHVPSPSFTPAPAG